MFKRTLFIGCLLFLLLASAAPATFALTQEQAVKLASDFCQRTGAPAVPTATAQCPSPQDTHWQARWRVVFPRQATVEVVDVTGDIVYYVNDAWYEQTAHDNRPAGVAISETEAIRRASSILTATGDTKELAFDKATLVQTHKPPLASCHTWIVSWTRQFQNVPYRHQGANVLLDAETGTVKILCKNFPTPPPPKPVFKVSREQAAQVAVRKLEEAGAKGVSPVKVQAEVVQPNTFWMPGGSDVEEVPISWVVWMCRFEIGEQKCEIWVDTEMEGIIGGTMYGYLGSAQKPESAFRNMPKMADELRQLLESTEEVKVYMRSKTPGKEWEDKPLVILSKESESKMFRLLKEKTHFPFERGRLLLVPDSKLVIVSKGKTYEVGYSFHSGHVLAAAPDQWGKVDDKFKDWLLKKMPASK